MESLHDRTWLAVKGKSPESIWRDLGLHSGQPVTRRGRFALEGASSDAGWYLIVAKAWDHRLIQPAVLTVLSAGCEVLTCTVDERHLASIARGWRDGHQVWAVTYQGEDRPGEVAVEGTLPADFAAVRDELIEKSRAEDAGDLLLDPLFEIPIEIVHRTVGFRNDEPSAAFDGHFTNLEADNPTIMQRLFGG